MADVLAEKHKQTQMMTNHSCLVPVHYCILVWSDQPELLNIAVFWNEVLVNHNCGHLCVRSNWVCKNILVICIEFSLWDTKCEELQEQTWLGRSENYCVTGAYLTSVHIHSIFHGDRPFLTPVSFQTSTSPSLLSLHTQTNTHWLGERPTAPWKGLSYLDKSSPCSLTPQPTKPTLCQVLTETWTSKSSRHCTPSKTNLNLCEINTC